MTLPVQSPSPRSYHHWRAALAQHAVRLCDPLTGEYLHLSGQGRVRGTGYAWLGLPNQARTLRRLALNSGDAWPWTVVPREGEAGSTDGGLGK